MSAQPLDRKAIGLALSCYFVWGIFPIYWRLLQRLPALEILAHRFVWSFVFYLALYAWRRNKKSPSFRKQDRHSWLLAAASAALLGLNWGIYIYAVNSGQVLQGSLAYFINPLMNVAVGVLFFHEAFPRIVQLAITLAAMGVLYQAAFTSLFPWIALTLAVSFCSYGVIKKGLRIPPELSSFMEGAVGFIPAAAAAILLRINSELVLTPTEWGLLIGSGFVTGLPLYLFSAATQRLPYSLMGMMQYIGPTLQFLVGVYVFGEALPPSLVVSFSLIWTGVGCYWTYLLTRLAKKPTPAKNLARS